MTHLPSSPGLLVAGLPRALGRQPVNEVVLVGLSTRAKSVALVMSIHLDLLAALAGPANLADSALAAAKDDGAQALAAVVYADDAADHRSFGAQVAAAIVLRSESHGLHALDAVRVVGDRWASYLCTEPSCCPPEGTPITTPTQEPHRD